MKKNLWAEILEWSSLIKIKKDTKIMMSNFLIFSGNNRDMRDSRGGRDDRYGRDNYRQRETSFRRNSR